VGLILVSNMPTRIRKSKKNRQHNGQNKNRQHNGQKQKYKMTNSDLQNITDKTKDRTTRIALKTHVLITPLVSSNSYFSIDEYTILWNWRKKI